MTQMGGGSVTDTRLQRLARLALDTDPVAWVAAERAKGRSWAAIAADLTDRCGGGPPISRETVRLWTTAPLDADCQDPPTH